MRNRSYFWYQEVVGSTVLWGFATRVCRAFILFGGVLVANGSPACGLLGVVGELVARLTQTLEIRLPFGETHPLILFLRKTQRFVRL